MDFDFDFDIYPRLEATGPNKLTYRQFLEEIKGKYEGVYDQEGRRAKGKILETLEDSDCHNKIYISLMIGECPRMPQKPERCDCFVRFSSKVSGNLTTQAKPYIMSAYNIAQSYLGSRVHFWHELSGTDDKRQWGYYSSQEVDDADTKLSKLETEQQHGL